MNNRFPAGPAKLTRPDEIKPFLTGSHRPPPADQSVAARARRRSR